MNKQTEARKKERREEKRKNEKRSNERTKDRKDFIGLVSRPQLAVQKADNFIQTNVAIRQIKVYQL